MRVYIQARNTLKLLFYAEEMMETTFINLWNKRHLLEVEAIWHWHYLYGGVCNRCINGIRKRLMEEKSWPYFKKFSAAIFPSVGETFLNKEILLLLEKKLSLLLAITQQVFQLKGAGGLSVQDIGTQFYSFQK